MKSKLPFAQVHKQIKERRLFIGKLLKTSLATAVVFSVGEAKASDFFAVKKPYTVGDIMDIIIKPIPGAPFDKTVDTLKSGNRDIVVTGIVTTMFATH